MRAQSPIAYAAIRINKITFYAQLRAGGKINKCDQIRGDEKRLPLEGRAQPARPQ